MIYQCRGIRTLLTWRRSAKAGPKITLQVPISICLVVVLTILKNDGLKVNGVGMTSLFYEMGNNMK